MKCIIYFKVESILQFTAHRSTEKTNDIAITNLQKVANVRVDLFGTEGEQAAPDAL